MTALRPRGGIEAIGSSFTCPILPKEGKASQAVSAVLAGSGPEACRLVGFSSFLGSPPFWARMRGMALKALLPL